MMRKIISLVCALSVAAACTPAAIAKTAKKDIFKANFDEDNTNFFVMDFEKESDENYPVKFEGNYPPYTQIKTDENSNRYADINAWKYKSETYGVITDWTNGGYVFKTPITGGRWTVSFDFNIIENSGNYGNISLSSKNVAASELANQFSLIGISGDSLTINKSVPEGNLTAEKGKWYHYSMELDRSSGEYSAVITDESGDVAYSSGLIGYTGAFEGLMFSQSIHTYIDNIKISGEQSYIPDFVYSDGKDSYLTYSVTDGAARVFNSGQWRYGGFDFSEPITSGTYEIGFDFKLSAYSSSGYGTAYLTDEKYGGNNEPGEFRLIDIKKLDSKDCIYAGDQHAAVDFQKDTWYNYLMTVDKLTNKYEITITDMTNRSNKASLIGTNFPEKSISAIMFGTACDIYLDNMFVTSIEQSADISGFMFIGGNGEVQSDATAATEAVRVTFDGKADFDSCADKIYVLDESGAKVNSYGETDRSGKMFTLWFDEALKSGEYTFVAEAGIKSLTGGESGEELRKSFSVSDKAVLLNVDYDENRAELERFEVGYVPEYSVRKSGTNRFLDISPKYSNYGYSLSEDIPANGGKYKLTFDFLMPEPANTYVLSLTDKAYDAKGGNNVYNNFGLLRVEEGTNLFSVGGKMLTEEIFRTNTWFTYELVFERRTRQTELTIAEKENPEKRAHIKTVLNTGSGWGDGLPEKTVLNAFKFSRAGRIMIDNIYLEKLADYPVTVSAKSEHTGNIFAMSDDKLFNVDIKNVTGTEALSQIGYKVYDEYGCIKESSNVGEFNLSAGEQTRVQVHADTDRYGIYKIVFDISCGNMNYTSDEYAFSVVNKRKDGEKLNSAVGVNTDRPDNIKRWSELKEVMLQAGISGMRTDLRWGDVEKEKGVYTNPDYTEYYKDAVDSGIENLVILNAINSIYSDGSRPDQSSEDIYTAWEAYVNYVTNAYKGEVTYYEIINEPNERISDYSVYADYMKRAKTIISNNDFNAKTMGFSTASLPWSWIKGVLGKIRSNPKAYLDVLTVHPYDFDYGDLKTSVPGLEWCIRIRDSKYRSNVDTLKTYMSGYGASSVPVQSTEMGITSTPGVCSLRAQAAELLQTYTITAAQGKIDKTWWYCLENTSARGSDDAVENDTEGNFGLVGNKADTVPMAAKPSYAALCGYNKMLTGATFKDDIRTNDGTSVYRFNAADGEQVIVLWTEVSEENFALNLGADSAEMYDMYTNSIGKIYADNGVFNITSSFEPIYLKGNFSSLRLGACGIYADLLGNKISPRGSVGYVIKDEAGRDLRLEIKTSGNITGSVSGNIVMLDARSGAKNEEPVEIKAYDGDKMIYIARQNLSLENHTLARLKSESGTITSFSDISDGEYTLVINSEYVTGKNPPLLYIAYYDASGRLTGLDRQTVEFNSRGANSLSVTVSKPENTKHIRFILTDNGGVNPICGSLDFISYN